MDKLHEECGVVGIWGKTHQNIGEKLYDGLISLQHRGQESAGMACYQINRIVHYKNSGLVKEVFDDERLSSMTGTAGIGHVRYSTTGSDERKNAQPIVSIFKGGQVAIAHNGNLVNALALREEMIDQGHMFETAIDSEVILHLIARHYKGDALEALRLTCLELRGAYALTILLNDRLYAVRDPFGLRPLVLGKSKDGFVVASETPTLDLLEADFMRDVQKGEILEISEEGVKSLIFDDQKKKALCSFEFVYFARPDSKLDGQYVLSVRKRLGALLAQKDTLRYDVVAPVPDSGGAAAIGYSHASGVPYSNVLMKNKYIGRTFINPTQEQRERALKLKLNVHREEVQGKRVVLVDDSIVRGTTMRRLIFQLKEAGAKEVHVRISSPPVIHSCFFGIDTPSKKALIGANFSEAQICEHIGADSLKFITIDELQEAIGLGDTICKACFDGNYPMAVPSNQSKFMFEK